MKQKENYNSFKKIMKFIANIISWTVLIVLLLIAAFLLYYYISTKLYATKGDKFEPKVGLYTIVSPSMTPNLNVYDVILDVKVEKPEDIKVGDIITFVSTSSISRGLTVTHRVVAILETENGLEYKTQGDNNLTPDTTTVQFKNILGKVAFKIPQLGRVQEFLSSSAGWLLVVVIPALMIIISDVLKVIKLAGAKQKVSEALIIEEQKNAKEEKKKEDIKKNLKKKYYHERSKEEPDPLETKKELKKVSKSKKSEQEENDIFLPKLKEEKVTKKKRKRKKKAN